MLLPSAIWLPARGGEQVRTNASSRPKWRPIQFILIGASAILLSALGIAIARGVHRYRIRPIPFVWRTSLPDIAIVNGSVQVSMPNGNLLGNVGQYSDELTAYLRFEYLRGLSALAGSEILMTSTEEGGTPVYRLYAVMQNDVIEAADRLGSIRIEGLIDGFRLVSPPDVELADWEKQTRLFDAAYHQPVRKRLLQLPESELTSNVAKFILFKVRTDRRVWKQIVPAKKVVTADESLRFAADMIAVAKFYEIPLSLLLGVGAMENNYLDIRGDLKHTTWKRHAEPGDIVLKRSHGRVLVSNYSVGPWQITRETLRYAHRLYLEDRRDYSKLPPRLRPPRKLDLNNVSSDVLTTYAGLLLRNLLGKFHGDVAKAVGAYNGGPGNPNMSYAEGVELVSTYAHRVLSMAADRNASAVEATPLKVENVKSNKAG
jgi:hypothetical protein